MRKVTLLLVLTAAVLSVSVSAGTVAYWRFEEGPANALVPHAAGANTWAPGTMDSSGNDYHLSSWLEEDFCGERYRTAVRFPHVPLTGAANTFCLQSTGDVPGMWTENSVLDTWQPTTWTVEAFACSTATNAWRAIVSRDGDDVVGDQPMFRIMMTDQSAFRASFCDMSKTLHELNTANGFIQANRWYHVAATCDGTTFILYVDGIERARKVLNSADPRMSDGSNGRIPAAGADWHPGAWTVFRGMWNGGHSDRWFGYIDEVRISDTALTPDQFLNSGAILDGPSDWAVFPEDVTTASFTVTAGAVPFGHSISDVTWYMDATEPNMVIVPDGLKYSVNTTGTQSTLTIYDVTAADEADYHAKATFTNGAMVNSLVKGHLYIRSGLVNRYSFDSDASDSVGGAHGVIVDPNALNPLVSFVDGQMVVNNPDVNANPADVNDFAYVDLPAGMVSSLENFMTIEVWVTSHRKDNWSPIFAFGDTGNANPFVDGFNFGRVGVLGQYNRDGNDRPSFTRITSTSAQRHLTSDNATIALDEEFMYAVTWNGNTNQMRLYMNGVLMDTDNIDMRLSDIEDVKCWLGLGFWGDSVANYSMNEFRIYDTALPSYYINAHYVAGPDVTAVELKPAVSAASSAAVFPSLRADDEDSAELTASVTDKPIGTTVANAVWFKDIDPAISGDEVQLSDDAKYDISWTDEGTTLKVNTIDSSDEAYYYAKVTLNTGASGTGTPGKLTVSQGLVHRWSFDGDLTDSVGGAHGTLVDASGIASFVSGSQLLLPNPSSAPNANPAAVAYVSLPAGIIPALDNYATIEMWVTPYVKQSTDWINMFAFGRDFDGDPANYTGGNGLIGSLKGNGQANPLFTHDMGAAQRWIAGGPAPEVNQEFLFAMSWDGNNGVGNLYVIDANGTRVASATFGADRVLANIEDTANIIGGNWWNDYMINGSINEVRIYDWAYDRAWIEEHYAAGPNTLYVNPCLVRPQFDLAGGGEFGDEPDCKVDMSDLAAFAQEWLECGRLEGCL